MQATPTQNDAAPGRNRKGRKPDAVKVDARRRNLAIAVIKRDHPDVTNAALALMQGITIRTVQLRAKRGEQYPEFADREALDRAETN